jgi:hypothetical protein
MSNDQSEAECSVRSSPVVRRMGMSEMTFEKYAATVAKMVENHGVLNASRIVPAMDWLRDAYEWGLSPVRAATRATNQIMAVSTKGKVSR